MTGRWRGFLSLIGLLLSLLIVLSFIVPAILRGESPLVVAIVGSLAIILTTIALARGVGRNRSLLVSARQRAFC